MTGIREQLAVGFLMLAWASSCSSSPGTGGRGGNGGAGAGPVGGAGGTANGGGNGGAGADPVGGAGGTTDPNVCGPRDAFGTHISVGITGARTYAESYAYGGPATVERSTNDELLLVYTSPPNDGADGGITDPDAGAQAATPLRHAVIRGLEPMPRFPLAGKVWLSVNFVNNPATSTPTDPWSIAVRDREGGALLFGAALNPWDQGPRSPVPISAPAADCTVPNYRPGCSFLNTTTDTTTMTYQSVTMQGDTSVVIHDSQPGKVSLGGIDYDVRLTARKLGTPCWFNSPNADGIALDIQASDLASRAAALDIGAPPSCGLGNDPSHDLFFDINKVASRVYDGAVSFKGVEASGATYDFDVPGLPTTDGETALLRLVGAGAILPQPTVGQQFWLSSGNVDVLREAQQGRILLAQFRPSGPDSASELALALGVAVTLEPRCAYTESTQLWDAIFGTTPPVRVASGTIGTLVIDGRTYHAWFSGSAITIYPAN